MIVADAARQSLHHCGVLDSKSLIAELERLKSEGATGTVRIERQGVDRYGRTLARVTVNGRDVGAYLVSRGLARPWEK